MVEESSQTRNILYEGALHMSFFGTVEGRARIRVLRGVASATEPDASRLWTFCISSPLRTPSSPPVPAEGTLKVVSEWTTIWQLCKFLSAKLHAQANNFHEHYQQPPELQMKYEFSMKFSYFIYNYRKCFVFYISFEIIL